jgi:hypothetical protein
LQFDQLGRDPERRFRDVHDTSGLPPTPDCSSAANRQ